MAITNCQNDLEFTLLRTFLAVTRYGSMGRAATAIHRTQPAVSQQMSRLEKIIGNKVFSRTRGGVRLTRHGETLVHYANRALELNEEALARLREEGLLGPFRVGVSEDAALAILIPALKRFRISNSNLLLEISVAGSNKLNCLLREGEIDFAIGAPNLVDATPFMQWQARPAWFASTALSIDPLRTLPLVLWQSSGSWHDGILDLLRRSSWEARVVFESTSLDSTLAAVESGLGVAAFFRETVRNAAVAEIKDIRLPALPVINFAMFRGPATSSRAQELIEAAMATALHASAPSSVLPDYSEACLQVDVANPKIHDAT